MDISEPIQVLRGLVQDNAIQPACWRAFEEFCRRHRIEGFVFFQYRKLGYDLPPDLTTRWRHVLFEQGRQNRMKLDCLEKIKKEIVVPWILLKGPHVALQYYDGLQKRHLGDLDLLVAPSDICSAEAGLQRLGLRRKTPYLAGRFLTLAFLHALEFEGHQAIDLHYRLRGLPWLKIDLRRFWADSELLRLGRETYRVPSPSDTLLLYILGLHDDMGRGNWQWKSWLDVVHILRHIDSLVRWEEFFSARKDEGLEEASKCLLQAAIDIFRAADMIPFLKAYLTHHPPRSSVAPLLTKTSNALQNRLLWAKLFDAPTPLPLIWWLLSLPVRYYAHR